MGNSMGTSMTPARVTVLYPKAFTVINVSDGNVAARRDELVQAIRRGDVLLFRAWWQDRDFSTLQGVLRAGDMLRPR